MVPDEGARTVPRLAPTIVRRSDLLSSKPSTVKFLQSLAPSLVPVNGHPSNALTAKKADLAVFRPPRTRGAPQPLTSRTFLRTRCPSRTKCANAPAKGLRECRATRHQRVSASSLGRRTKIVGSRSEGERPADPVRYGTRNHRAVEAGNRPHPAETFLRCVPGCRWLAAYPRWRVVRSSDCRSATRRVTRSERTMLGL